MAYQPLTEFYNVGFEVLEIENRYYPNLYLE